jgi:hypothetical protein
MQWRDMPWLLPVLLQLSVALALMLQALAARRVGNEAAYDACVARALAVLERAVRRAASRRAACGAGGLARERRAAARAVAATRRRPRPARAARRGGARAAWARPVQSRTRIGGLRHNNLCHCGARGNEGRARGAPIRPPDRRKHGLRPTYSAAYSVTK